MTVSTDRGPGRPRSRPAAPGVRTRVRQPADLARLVFDALGVAVVLALGSLAPKTTTGLDVDLRVAAEGVPSVLVGLAWITASLAALAVPVTLIVDLLVRRQARLIPDVLLAAGVGVLASLGLNAELLRAGRDSGLLASFTVLSDGHSSPPTATYLVAIVAAATVAELAGRRFARVAVWGGVSAAVLTALLGRSTTALALVLTLLLGHLCGVAVRYTLGRYSHRSSPRAIVEALRRSGVDVMSLRPAPAHVVTGPYRPRQYLAVGHDGSRVEVDVLDQDRQGAGLLYLLWRSLLVRWPVHRRATFSLRRAVEHESLLSLAAYQFGVRTPKLVAVTEAAGESALVAFEHVPGRRFSALAPHELSDEQLCEAWRQVVRLHGRGLAHRTLTADSLLLDDHGAVWLRGLRAGDVAASDLAMRLDLAQLLTTFALLVGIERAVLTAHDALGSAQLAHVLPLLQPIALSRTTRQALRTERTLLPQLRAEVLERTSAGPVEQVRLQRIPLRTLITAVASVLALYVLAGQMASANLRLLLDAQWGWGAAALGFSLITYLGATTSLVGFAPVRVRYWRTFTVQIAASFVQLVAPVSVGNVALNARYLQRRGVSGSLAVASVGLAQVVTFTVHVSLLVLFGFLTGRQRGGALVPSTGTLLLVGTVVALGVLVLLVPPWRAGILDRVRPTLRQVVPRILDIVQQPRKLALGLSGSLLLTLGYVLALEASVMAFGGGLGLASVAVAFLAGAAIGNTAPTPGGLGAVEGALLVTLGALGMPASNALAATLLFRFATFWAPLPVGWVAFTALQRRAAI